MQYVSRILYHEQRIERETSDVKTYVYTYPRPMVTVDAVVFAGADRKSKVALIRRKHDPFAGSWALPGGFVDMEESLMGAAIRELHEETGLSGISLKQLHAFGAPGRDPRGRSISVAYWGRIPSPMPLHAADDAAEADWFPVSSLPSLAFDHDEIILFALRKLEAK